MRRRISSREVLATALGADIDEVEVYQRSRWQYEGRAYSVGPKPPEPTGWRLFETQPTWLGIPPRRLVWEEVTEV